MSQKVLFYQEDRPKTADGLWMHKDSDGNMKIDYVGNNMVYPVTSCENSGGTSAGVYKPLLIIATADSSAWPNTGSSGNWTIYSGEQLTAQAVAALLGIPEEDFSNMFTVGAPMYLKPFGAEGNNNDYRLSYSEYESEGGAVAHVRLVYENGNANIELSYDNGLYTVYYRFYANPK